MDNELRTAYAFFKAHAGYCTPPGKAACALRLAKAERWAIQQGIGWNEEPDRDPNLSWMSKAEQQEDHEVIGIVLCFDAPDYAYSLWGITDADDAYKRVVAAELYRQAMDDATDSVLPLVS